MTFLFAATDAVSPREPSAPYTLSEDETDQAYRHGTSNYRSPGSYLHQTEANDFTQKGMSMVVRPQVDAPEKDTVQVDRELVDAAEVDIPLDTVVAGITVLPVSRLCLSCSETYPLLGVGRPLPLPDTLALKGMPRSTWDVFVKMLSQRLIAGGHIRLQLELILLWILATVGIVQAANIRNTYSTIDAILFLCLIPCLWVALKVVEQELHRSFHASMRLLLVDWTAKFAFYGVRADYRCSSQPDHGKALGAGGDGTFEAEEDQDDGLLFGREEIDCESWLKSWTRGTVFTEQAYIEFRWTRQAKKTASADVNVVPTRQWPVPAQNQFLNQANKLHPSPVPEQPFVHGSTAPPPGWTRVIKRIPLAGLIVYSSPLTTSFWTPPHALHRALYVPLRPGHKTRYPDALKDKVPPLMFRSLAQAAYDRRWQHVKAVSCLFFLATLTLLSLFCLGPSINLVDDWQSDIWYINVGKVFLTILIIAIMLDLWYGLDRGLHISMKSLAVHWSRLALEPRCGLALQYSCSLPRFIDHVETSQVGRRRGGDETLLYPSDPTGLAMGPMALFWFRRVHWLSATVCCRHCSFLEFREISYQPAPTRQPTMLLQVQSTTTSESMDQNSYDDEEGGERDYDDDEELSRASTSSMSLSAFHPAEKIAI